MGKIITVASQKGGVGKTTTALNLGYSLSRFGQKVLLVDADVQGGMVIMSNLKKRTTMGLLDILKNNARAKDVVIATKDNTMGVLGPGVTQAEDIFAFEREARKGNVGKLIASLSESYDYTFIDASAGVSSVVTSLLSVSDSVLLPISCRIISVRTLPLFLKLIQKIRRNVNPALMLEGILITMAEDMDAESEVFDEIVEHFPASVLFQTIIPYDDAFEMAGIKSIPVGMLEGGEEAAQAYMNLAIEFKTRELSQTKQGADEDEGLF